MDLSANNLKPSDPASTAVVEPSTLKFIGDTQNLIWLEFGLILAKVNLRACFPRPATVLISKIMSKAKLTKLDEAVMAKQEFQRNSMAAKLNWLRAGVLGANDGIVSTAGLVMGVAGATTDSNSILIAGVAGLVAGSISMAGGEYTSVSAQKDSEIASLSRERRELAEDPEGELRELAWFYEQKGLSLELATKVAKELTARDAIKAHAEAELGIDSEQHASPTQAAFASFVAFAAGSLLPLLAVTGPWIEARIPVTVIAVVASLAITGFVGAKIGGARSGIAIIRNVVVSLLTMGITFAIGSLVGTAI
jgi:vacuolar iron transporter family protein